MGSFVRIQSVKKRAFLNQVVQGAISTASTLTATLTAVQTQCYSPTFQKGRVVVSQSGSGQSGSFMVMSPSSGGEWTPDNIFGLTQELIELIAFCISDGSFGGTDDGQNTSTLTLQAAMCAEDSLQGVTEQHGDFTSLRFPVTR